MSDLVTAFIAYRTKRNELKKKYREQLEHDLEPYLAEFGKAVVATQSEGKSVDEVEHLIGVKNRNLIYTAKRAAKGVTPPPAPTTPDPAPEAADAPSEPRVRVFNDAGTPEFEVYIDSDFKGTVRAGSDGNMDIPEEWALDTENQSLYREAVAKVRAALKE